VTGGGAWNPGNDSHLWVKFNLRAHPNAGPDGPGPLGPSGSAWRVLDELTATIGSLTESRMRVRRRPRLPPAPLVLCRQDRHRRTHRVPRLQGDGRRRTADRRRTDLGPPLQAGPRSARWREATRRATPIVDPYRGSRTSAPASGPPSVGWPPAL
jgi:hypothetical protein